MSPNLADSVTKKPQVIILIILAIILPLVLGAVYITQTRDSEASASCAPEDIRTERASNSAGRVLFSTTCSVKAQIYCSVGVDGVQFVCGEDDVATTTHIIETTDVTLNSDTPYFVYIDTKLENRTLGYIPASPDDATVGLSFDEYDENTYGLSAEDEGFDISQDVNQDGVINGLDRSEFYPEFSQ